MSLTDWNRHHPRILITGGCGFIGSTLVRLLVKKYPDYQFINLDKLTYAGNRANLADIESAPNYTFIQGDICDIHQEPLAAQVGPVEAVLHLAAESHVDRSIQNSGIFVQTNVQGTHSLLDFARRTGVKRFIHISTDEVYGSLGSEGYFTEETPLAPNSPYSASKAGSDLLVRAYYHTYGFPAVIMRCSNNYGPYQYPEKLLPLMINNALRNLKLPVYGDGMNIRDWLYVEDHCRAIDLVLHQGKTGEVYNVGGNNEWHNIDIVKLLLKDLNKPESLIQFVEDRLGHDRRYAIDANKIRTELGWEPQVNFEQGLQMTIQWYVDHQPWIEDIRKKQQVSA
jgi:dTDP-glucose 4,6-dehydratase